MKFNVGDRVIFNNSVGVPDYVTVGDTGVIAYIGVFGYKVKMDKDGNLWSANDSDVSRETFIQKLKRIFLKLIKKSK